MVNAAAAFVCVVVIMIAGASVFAFAGAIPHAGADGASGDAPRGDGGASKGLAALDGEALLEQSPKLVRNLILAGFLLLSLVFFIRYQEEFL